MSETRSKPADQVRSTVSDLIIKNWIHSLGNGLYKIRPRFKDKHFWIVQFLIIVITAIHDVIEMGGYLHHLEVLYFVPISLFLIPVVYAALYFGLAGSIATVIWATIITIPNWVFWHEGLERLGVIFQMSLLFTVAIFTGIRVDREAEARRKAEDTGALLGTYAAHVLQVQEEERQRIARELHDQTLQTLSLMSQRLVSMEDKYSSLPHAVNEEMRQIHEMAEEAIKELRDFTRSIRPPILDDLGLVPSIRRLLIESTERTGMKGTFKLIGDEMRLQEDIEVSIFRIIQEAIWNVERHSKAKQVIITMILNESETKIDVNDDGIGFDVPSKLSTFYTDGKLGLLGMQERAKLIGGKLEVKSAPNMGTNISFQMK